VETGGTKADEISLAIEEAIVLGELAPGSVLRQETLSTQYGVSRTPLREALRRLEALGLVSFEPNRGFRVRTLRRQEMWETFLLRAQLEGLVTGIAAERVTEDDLAELEQAEQRFSRLARALRAREPGDDRRSLSTQWMQANHGFHDVIYRVAEMPYIEQVAKSARRTFSGPAVWAPGDETIDELYLANERQHRAIQAAIAARSPEGASALAREHVLSSFHLLETILNQVGARPQGWAGTDGPDHPGGRQVDPVGSLSD
jgi:DNA-binding GntR family transcriptional regulator